MIKVAWVKSSSSGGGWVKNMFMDIINKKYWNITGIWRSSCPHPVIGNFLVAPLLSLGNVAQLVLSLITSISVGFCLKLNIEEDLWSVIKLKIYKIGRRWIWDNWIDFEKIKMTNEDLNQFLILTPHSKFHNLNPFCHRSRSDSPHWYL